MFNSEVKKLVFIKSQLRWQVWKTIFSFHCTVNVVEVEFEDGLKQQPVTQYLWRPWAARGWEIEAGLDYNPVCELLSHCEFSELKTE